MTGHMLRHCWWSLLLLGLNCAIGVETVAEDAMPEETRSQQAAYLESEPQNEPLLPPELSDNPEQFGMGLSEPAELDALPPWIVPGSSFAAASWTSGSGDGLGITDLEARHTLMLPRLPGMMISLGTGFHFLQGPSSTDLPPTLYDQTLEFRMMRPLNERWMLDLAVAPSLFSDYENLSSDAVRITGRALAFWSPNPQWKFAFGAIYLDREDIAALPAAGAIWTPNDDYTVELMFPRPRVMRRLSTDGEQTKWVYLGGEFGGGSWAIDRADGSADVFTYSALRLLVGYEVKRKKGFAPRIEGGYLFNRQVEYKSGIGNYDPDSAAMIRAGASF